MTKRNCTDSYYEAEEFRLPIKSIMELEELDRKVRAYPQVKNELVSLASSNHLSQRRRCFHSTLHCSTFVPHRFNCQSSSFNLVKGVRCEMRLGSLIPCSNIVSV